MDNKTCGTGDWPLDGSITLRAPNGQPFQITQNVQLKSLQQLSQTQQDELFLANVQKGDSIELPTYIFVETRFITKNTGEDLENIEFFGSMETPRYLDSPTESLRKNRKCSSKTFANAAVYAGVVQKECGSMTDSGNPTRNRCVQTDAQLNSKTVGIQCSIEMELDFGADVNLSELQLEDEKQQKLEFSLYAVQNSRTYPNGNLECSICGEMTRKQKSMDSHLRLHYGPSVLCFKCGLQFEHKVLLLKHTCDAKKQKRLHCPHHLCNILAISELELYDHINEHTFDNCYECKLCKKNYPTNNELEQHIKLRKHCRAAQSKLRNPYKKLNLSTSQSLACRQRVQVIYTLKGLKALRVSRLDKCAHAKAVRQCPICLRTCSNEFKFQKHRKRCLSSYFFRYKMKCMKENRKGFGTRA